MKFIDWFAGIGGFHRGMELAGHECVGFCEFDKYAVMSYTAMHLCTQEQLDYLATLPLKQRQKEILKDEYKNGEWYADDVRRVDARDIPEADCWCFGFPCFTGDTLILTYDGYKEIKDVAVGDKVLTHTGKWQRVTSVMKRDSAELWEVRGFGILPTLTTEEHPYYLTKDKVNYEWVKVKDIGDDYYSTLTLPKTIDSDNHTAEWWWVAGRYLADGWTIKRKDRNCGGRVVIACNDEKLDDTCKRIKEAGFNYSVSTEQTCNKVHITNNNLYEELQMFGKYAYGKNVPGSVLELPIEKATAFYNGYMSGDGRCDKEEATSVSPYLILGMALVAIKIGKNHPGIYKTTRNSKCVIEGRECNQRDTYTFRVCNRSVKSSESNGIWCRRINRPVNTSRVGTVYNISVEEDQSYIANGAIVHNCQDISVAGKGIGFNGKRSSLFFEVMRLLDERKANGLSRPGYLFIENVKNLLSVNRGIDFAKVLFALDERGYDAEWTLLNSKNFNVPQNRERVFIIGHLRGRSTAEVFPVEGTDGTDCIFGINQVGHDGYSHRNNPNQYRVYDPSGLSPCLNQMGGGGLEPHIIDPKYYKLEGGVRVYENCTPTLTSRDYKDPLMVTQDVGINPTLTCNKNGGNRVAIPVLTPKREKKRQNGRRFKEDGEEAFTLTGQDRHGVAVGIDDLYVKREPRFYDEEAPTLRSDRYGLKAAVKVEPVETSCNQGIFVQVSEDLTVYAAWYPKKECYIAIRKLTPRECFRLQGWTDDYFGKAEFVNSNSQLYKQAGNGVTVSVIEAIARKMK